MITKTDNTIVICLVSIAITYTGIRDKSYAFTIYWLLYFLSVYVAFVLEIYIYSPTVTVYGLGVLNFVVMFVFKNVKKRLLKN